MGTKFYNINIYGADIGNVKGISNKYEYYSVSPKWVTVVSDYFQWGDTGNHAKKISEALNTVVLSTEYFDDDYVEFAVYENGKLLTKHIPMEYEDLEQQCGDTKQFINAFKMDDSDEEILEKIFEVEDCETSVYLMESILGCPIYGIDNDYPPEEAPDRTFVTDFMNGN